MHHLNAIEADRPKPHPGVQAVEVIDSTFVVELEGKIDSKDAKHKGNCVKDQMDSLLYSFAPRKSSVAHRSCNIIKYKDMNSS